MITMICMKDLGEALLRRREQLGLTQRQFGDRIGKDPAYISRLEQGRAKETPAPEVLRAIQGVLGLSEAQMLAMVGYAVGEPIPEGDVVTVPADDPRADLLRLLEGETDEAVRNVAGLIGAAKRLSSSSIIPAPQVPSPGKTAKTESPNTRTA